MVELLDFASNRSGEKYSIFVTVRIYYELPQLFEIYQVEIAVFIYLAACVRIAAALKSGDRQPLAPIFLLPMADGTL